MRMDLLLFGRLARRAAPYLVIVALGYLLFVFMATAGGPLIAANDLVDQIANVIPLNKYNKSAAFYGVLFLLLIIPTLAFIKKYRRYAKYYTVLLLCFFNLILGWRYGTFIIDPISGEATKCYIVLDGKVVEREYGSDKNWIYDPETGLKCTPVTPEIAPLIRQASRGALPKKISDTANPDFFDRALGQPIVFYFRADSGEVELFDNPGVHPQSGALLQPITEEVGKLWKKQRDLRLEATRQREEAAARAVEKAEREKELAERKAREEAAREREAEQKRIAAQKAEAERLRKAELQRQAAAAQMAEACDRSAGNSLDPNRNRSLPGVTYTFLSINASNAIAACEQAARANPTVARYQYQLARAYQATGDKRALALLTDLAARNYPASFDNLGWFMFNQGKVPTAVNLFRQGVQAGSAEAMFSYAGLLFDGKYVDKDEDQAFSLFQRASELGHPDATLRVTQIQETRQNQELAKGIIATGILTVLNGMAQNRR